MPKQKKQICTRCGDLMQEVTENGQLCRRCKQIPKKEVQTRQLLGPARTLAALVLLVAFILILYLEVFYTYFNPIQ